MALADMDVENESLLNDLMYAFGALMTKVDDLVARNTVLESQVRDYAAEVSEHHVGSQ